MLYLRYLRSLYFIRYHVLRAPLVVGAGSLACTPTSLGRPRAATCCALRFILRCGTHCSAAHMTVSRYRNTCGILLFRLVKRSGRLRDLVIYTVLLFNCSVQPITTEFPQRFGLGSFRGFDMGPIAMFGLSQSQVHVTPFAGISMVPFHSTCSVTRYVHVPAFAMCGKQKLMMPCTGFCFQMSIDSIKVLPLCNTYGSAVRHTDFIGSELSAQLSHCSCLIS